MIHNRILPWARGLVAPIWKWVSRRPHPYIFLVALGAGVMAGFADHSLWSVLGSAFIAGGLAHLLGEKIGIPVAISLPIQSLIPLLLGDKAEGFRPVGVKFWLWLLLALPVVACGLGIFFGGAMLVGTLTERALDEPGKENQNNVLKPVSWLFLGGLVAFLTVGFVYLCGGF